MITALAFSLALRQDPQPATWEELNKLMGEAYTRQENYVDTWELMYADGRALRFSRIHDRDRSRIDISIVSPNLQVPGTVDLKPVLSQVISRTTVQAVLWPNKEFATANPKESNPPVPAEPGTLTLGLSATEFVFRTGLPMKLESITSVEGRRVAVVTSVNPETGNRVAAEIYLMAHQWLPTYAKITVHRASGTSEQTALRSLSIFIDAKLPKNPFSFEKKALKDFKKVPMKDLLDHSAAAMAH